MEYFILDYEAGTIVGCNQSNVANLQQFIKDLDETFGEQWFDNIHEAKEAMMEYLGIDTLEEIM